MKTDDQIRSDVREHYGAIARSAQACCEPTAKTPQAGCCAPTATGFERGEASRVLGYSAADMRAVPETANLGLGCGNPQAIAELRAGEVVVDLGAGGGFDAFLAARAVGQTGRVIGVDMSADMVALARTNAAKHAAANVEFRLGEIEHMPVPDATADVIMSNCVINLAPDKRAVYAEALRVLKPGGRLAISDVVALAPMPQHLADDVAARCGCIAGAALASELPQLLAEVGFTDVRVDIDPASADVIASWAPGEGLERLVASARIRASKPGGPANKSAGPAGADTGTKAGACCEPGCCS
ncbi:MAG TPA: arsenite methyltransferase [Kofleriaceae bacterium]|nr:arsenite methyltransferase [Kofleriaceae bacterium]